MRFTRENICSKHLDNNLFITDAGAFSCADSKNPSWTNPALSWKTSVYIIDQEKKRQLKKFLYLHIYKSILINRQKMKDEDFLVTFRYRIHYWGNQRIWLYRSLLFDHFK